MDGVAVSGDGSLLLVDAEGEEGAALTALVRAPAPLGTLGSWRKVAVPGAIAYRVGSGGVVAAVVPEGDSGERFRLVIDRRAGEAPVEIARALSVEGGLADVGFTTDGRILVHRHSLTGDLMVLVVTTSGTLAPSAGTSDPSSTL